MHTPIRTTLSAAVLTLALAPLAAAHQVIEIEGDWVRAVPAGKPNAAYMTVHNRGDQTITLEGARSSQFKKIELHETMEHDGAMMMMEAKSIDIPPGESFEMRPGGHHLMLMKPRDQVMAGDEVNINLRFSGGIVIPVQSTAKGP